jgi:hypothetical protein
VIAEDQAGDGRPRHDDVRRRFSESVLAVGAELGSGDVTAWQILHLLARPEVTRLLRDGEEGGSGPTNVRACCGLSPPTPRRLGS